MSKLAHSSDFMDQIEQDAEARRREPLLAYLPPARRGLLWSALFGCSSYAAKTKGVWQEIMDLIEDCVLPKQLSDAMFIIASRRAEISAAWDESIAEIIEKRREEIEADDIDAIMRRNFDF